jgi:outer membrane biosynthesis protein TonB
MKCLTIVPSSLHSSNGLAFTLDARQGARVMWFRGLAISMLAAACASSARPPSNTAKPAQRAQSAAPAPSPAAAYPAVRPATLTPDLVLATIRDRYLSGVERCYSRHAKKLGTANGRVIVSFTVDEDGSTRDSDARGITKRVDKCIRAQVARWTFPAPRKESAFSLGLQLSTD